MNVGVFSRLLQDMGNALNGESDLLSPPHIQGEGVLNSYYPVTEFAAASISCAGQALQLLRGETAVAITINPHLSSHWFVASHRPINRSPAELWDTFSGDYATRDGWIRLHTNSAHHRKAMENVLGESSDRQQLAKRVENWRKDELEEAIIMANGCAAAMRSHDEWLAHPQGATLANEPLFRQQIMVEAPSMIRPYSSSRPLHNVNVLDLTRIIAGPVATRFLAGLGANVLRLDPPGWDEPTLAEEVTLGKRCARINLKSHAGRQLFQDLLAKADVIVHGYRADALETLGYDARTRQTISPGLVDVSLNAWGWSGPWRNRRGFDSLVQMACGISAQVQQWQQADHPVPLPVQALDHATGYLMAAAVLEGLRIRRDENRGYRAQLSLARTAALLMEYQSSQHRTLEPVSRHDWQPLMEWSKFGLGQRLQFPIRVPGVPVIWSKPPRPIGIDEACWE